MATYTHYGNRGRADRSPGANDTALLLAGAAGLAGTVGLILAAGLLDGLLLAGHPPTLQHRSIAAVVSAVFEHPGRPYRAFASTPRGVVTSPWAYWSILAVMLAAVVAVAVYGSSRLGAGAPKPTGGSPRRPRSAGRRRPGRPPKNETRPAPTWPTSGGCRPASSGSRSGGPSPPAVSPCEARGRHR